MAGGPGMAGGPPLRRPVLRPPVFVADAAQLRGDRIVLSGAEGRHAATVRRLAPGERADVTDGDGTLAECVVTGSGPDLLELAVLGRRADPPPDPRIVVVQAIPKGDRGELAVEIMTEVGVDVVVPWAAERCVAKWRGDRGQRALERWRVTAREAAKQARRARFPEITAAAETSGVARLAAAAAAAIILDPDAPAGLRSLPLPARGDIVVVIGPEGGVSPAEAARLTSAGAVSARLGPSVLRASSAGAVAAALLLSAGDRWR
jgi:16S rRNA (uracil1498-N3)-methyltransferase